MNEAENRRLAWLAKTWAWIPLVFLACMYLKFSPDYPYLDQWEFVPFLEKYDQGTLGWGDFWAQHNEHRIVLPRLIMLACAVLTQWDVRAELAVNVVLGASIFLTWLALSPITCRKQPLWAGLLSLLAFSLSQWQNWFLGWQLQVFLSVWCVCMSLWLLSRGLESPWGWMGASLAALVATFSFANGMLVWLCGGVLVLLMWSGTAPGTRVPRAGLFCWAVLGTAAMGAYLWGYARPEYHPASGAWFRHPLEWLRYVLVYLGQPVCNWSEPGAALAGLAALAGWVILPWRVAGRAPAGEWAPGWCLGLYAVLSAALTGAARLEMGGSLQAMSSRYATLANLLWFALLLLAVRSVPEASPPPWLRLAAAALALCLVAASLHGAYRWSERHHAFQPAREVLLQGNDEKLLLRLHPEPRLLLERREILRQHGLSLFRP